VQKKNLEQNLQVQTQRCMLGGGEGGGGRNCYLVTDPWRIHDLLTLRHINNWKPVEGNILESSKEVRAVAPATQ